MNGNLKWGIIQPLAGGFGIGFEKALGTPPSFVIDNSADNTKQYTNYLNNTRGLNVPVIEMDWDVTEFYNNTDIMFNKVKNVDIIAYVPICSGLSMLNNCTSGCNARGDANNNQNQNMYNLTTFILENISPKVACFENAPNAYSKSGEGVINKLREISEKYDYSMTVEKVDTYDFGIPQHRQRTFVYFWKNDTAALVKFEKFKTPSIIDFLSEISDDASLNDIYPISKYANQDATYEFIQYKFNKDKKYNSIVDVVNSVIDKHQNTSSLGFIKDTKSFLDGVNWADTKIKELENSDDIDESELKKYTNVKKKFQHCQNKLDQNLSFWDSSMGIATHRNYINALIGKNIQTLTHPYEDRCFTIRELIKFMGHPDDYELINPKKNCNMITQNVPVNTSSHAAKNCKLFCEDKLIITNQKFVKMNNINEKIDTKISYKDEW